MGLKYPYDRVEQDSPTLYIRKSGEKQTAPYTEFCSLSNHYHFFEFYRSENWQHDCRPVEPAHDYRAGDRSILERVNNLAYKRLVDQLGDTASLGATLTAEGRETYGLVVGGLVKMLTAARHIRKFRFGDAARELGLPYHERTERERYRVKRGKRFKNVTVKRKVFTLPTGREVPKTAANGWLLYSYGVSPLMGDIHSAMESLTAPFPYHRIRGAGRLSTSRLETWDAPAYRTYTTTVSCSIGVDVRVRNPNLWLANKLGLVNPIQMINEAIPMSFVVDWVSNLSDVISSMTDFVGLDLSRPCTNRFITRSLKGNAYFYPWSWYDYEQLQITKDRKLSFSPPTLLFAYERFNWQRGLNAISLLVGFLPNKK